MGCIKLFGERAPRRGLYFAVHVAWSFRSIFPFVLYTYAPRMISSWAFVGVQEVLRYETRPIILFPMFFSVKTRGSWNKPVRFVARGAGDLVRGQ